MSSSVQTKRAGPLSVDSQQLLADIEALARIGALDKGGVDRPAFSSQYRAAIEWLTARMQNAGLRVHQDPAGNLIGRLGSEGPAIVCGSHVDSVPSGGILDGALGVLAAIECVRAFRKSGVNLLRPLEVVAFADEEGAYLSLFGSRAMAGTLDMTEVKAAIGRDGRRLTDALAEYGLEPDRINQAIRPRGDVAGYLELHIEQGPVLEWAETPIGIVQSIVGIHEAEIRFTGLANHAGTTPMELRRDALRAASETMVEAYRAFEAECASDMRLTFGAISNHPNAKNVIPGFVRLTQEIRGIDIDLMDNLFKRCRGIASEVAESRKVAVTCEILSCDPPTTMDASVQQRIAEACSALGYGYRKMPSGAGHDAQVFAPLCPTGMIFIPSEGGVSHNAVERTSPDLIAKGLDVFCLVLQGWLAA